MNVPIIAHLRFSLASLSCISSPLAKRNLMPAQIRAMPAIGKATEATNQATLSKKLSMLSKMLYCGKGHPPRQSVGCAVAVVGKTVINAIM